MELEFDPAKRLRTLLERGLDFSRAVEIFAGLHLTQRDARRDYREARFITVGQLDRRVVVLVWTRRPSGVRVISLRKANGREQALFANRISGC
ncbi:MAG: BrnT family toxin [Proteobacteria bacterium]|nr:BrnT family toxin [Pseudomonadota bacterium]